jgi:hypothetical protein
MKLPRASMTTTLFVILVFAVDFGLTRDLLTHDRGSLSTFGLGYLPMATALVFGFYRLARLRVQAGAFTVGFVAVGLAASSIHLTAIQLVPALADGMDRLFQALDDRLLAAFPAFWKGDDLGLDELLVVGTILSLPPFLAALAGGWLARRFALGRETASRQRKKPRIWKRPRFTLASASILVAMLAVDLGIIRQMLIAVIIPWSAFVIGLLPMANVLVLGLFGLLRPRGRRGRFLFGFEVVGCLATLTYLAACVFLPWAVMQRFQWFALKFIAVFDLAIGRGWADHLPLYLGVAFEVVLCAAFFTLPPLVAALSGGAIIRRFGRTRASAA